MRWVVLVGLVVMVGCGTSAQQVASACDGFGWTQEQVDALIVALEWAKDAGATRDEARMQLLPACYELPYEYQADGILCLDALIDAVYGP